MHRAFLSSIMTLSHWINAHTSSTSNTALSGSRVMHELRRRSASTGRCSTARTAPSLILSPTITASRARISALDALDRARRTVRGEDVLNFSFLPTLHGWRYCLRLIRTRASCGVIVRYRCALTIAIFSLDSTITIIKSTNASSTPSILIFPTDELAISWSLQQAKLVESSGPEQLCTGHLFRLDGRPLTLSTPIPPFSPAPLTPPSSPITMTRTRSTHPYSAGETSPPYTPRAEQPPAYSSSLPTPAPSPLRVRFDLPSSAPTMARTSMTWPTTLGDATAVDNPAFAAMWLRVHHPTVHDLPSYSLVDSETTRRRVHRSARA